MITIRQSLVTGAARCVNAGANTRTYITVHETANPKRGADADAHARLLAGGNYRAASWHWTVDDHEAVQHYEHTARTWNAGDGTGPGNNQSIAVEICVNADGDYGQAVRNAAVLVARIMREENIPISRVVQHNRWTGKNCPTRLRTGEMGGWAGFLALVQDPLARNEPKTQEDDVMPFIISAADRGQGLISGRFSHLTTPEHVRAVMRLTPGIKIVECSPTEFDLMAAAYGEYNPPALGDIQRAVAELLRRPAAEVDAQALAEAIPESIAADVVTALAQRLQH